MLNLAAYVAGVQAVNITSTREIAPVLPFAAVLGRQPPGSRPAAWRRRPRPGGAPVALCAVLACYAAMLGYGAAQPPAPPQYAGLTAWLSAEHLTEGLSGYHQANIATLESGGAVTLRPVNRHAGGLIGAYTWNASAAWFDPVGRNGELPGADRTGRPRRSGRRGDDRRPGDGDVRPPRPDLPVRRVRDPGLAAGGEPARPAPLAAPVTL